MSVLSNRVLIAVALGCAVATGGCTKTRIHHGYVIDTDLANSIKPGVDNRNSVLRVMGRPTFASQFNDGEWYYLARNVSSFAFNRPKPVSQTTIRIRFDQSGTVSSVDKMGMEQVVSINPTDKKTPTLGRKRGFFEQLFGNIGTVTPGGVGGAGGGGQGQ
ncbi:outer membrane protein assembly factor BamE [Stakelama marina]|uniref:Outer membrane protein assembly factor BamE n=1 Tax=Stakelama marina TaxID=2826939 RepID=A0A8T4IFC2_9SPHN|nr:outer membrane protein assembly factor BamE [Stakelama marina]MBR0553317.1 outer membrane protein assembly factor BamE [Stakelama marina]